MPNNTIRDILESCEFFNNLACERMKQNLITEKDFFSWTSDLQLLMDELIKYDRSLKTRLTTQPEDAQFLNDFAGHLRTLTKAIQENNDAETIQKIADILINMAKKPLPHPLTPTQEKCLYYISTPLGAYGGVILSRKLINLMSELFQQILPQNELNETIDHIFMKYIYPIGVASFAIYVLNDMVKRIDEIQKGHQQINEKTTAVFNADSLHRFFSPVQAIPKEDKASEPSMLLAKSA